MFLIVLGVGISMEALAECFNDDNEDEIQAAQNEFTKIDATGSNVELSQTA